MFKQTFIVVGFLVFTFVISSCTKLKSNYYVGEKEKISTKDLKKETIWQYEDDVFKVRILDSLTVIASSLEWDDSKNEYKIVTFEVVYSRLGDDYFLNIKEADELYTILRIAVSLDGTIAFFTVNKNQIENDIKQGIVKAAKRDSDYILDINKKELDKYVSENINELFKIKTPGMIKPLVSITE